MHEMEIILEIWGSNARNGNLITLGDYAGIEVVNAIDWLLNL